MMSLDSNDCKNGDYEEYADMGLISDEGVVIGQHETILGSAVTQLTKVLPLRRRTAIRNWFIERNMSAMPLYLRDNSGKHISVMVDETSRRSDRFIAPTLLDGWNSSVVVHDAKGTYWKTTAGYRKIIGNTVIKFEPSATDDTSACWNPLDEIHVGSPDERFVTERLSSALIRMGKLRVCDDVVEKVADVLTEIILHLKNTYHAAQKPLSLYDVAQYIQDHTVGMIDEDGTPVYAWMDLDGNLYDDPMDYPYMSLEKPERVQKVIDHKLHDIVSIPNDKVWYILPVINAALKDYLDPVLRRHTESSDFCIRDLMNHAQPVSLYLVTPPGNSCKPSPIFRVFLEMLGIFGFKGKTVKGIHRCLLLMDILYPRMWTRRKKGWGKTLAKRCSEENDSRQCESFFMDRSRCRKLPLRLTEKPISMDSFKNVEFLEHGQSKKVWNPCNKTLVQGSESFRMDKVATVDER